MTTYNIPKREEVSTENQSIFDNLNSQLGFVPNLYATYAHSNYALKNYLTLNGAKSSLKTKEKEIVNLAVSEVNGCLYCLSAHTAIAKMNGFNEDQILEFRAGKSAEPKFDALAALAKNITENRGNANEAIVDNFYAQGWTKENLLDTIVLVGDKTISNYVNNLTQIPIDFPVAQPLDAIEA